MRKAIAEVGRDEPTAYETAYDQIVDKLLLGDGWLNEERPESEQQIAERFSLSKTSAREALQTLIRMGVLKRAGTTGGIARDILSVERLLRVFSFRLRAELAAVKKIFQLSYRERITLASQMVELERRQMQLVKEDSNFIEWVKLGYSYHCNILKYVGHVDAAALLESNMLRTRIGTMMGLTSVEEREASQTEHQAYIDLIGEGKPVPEWWKPIESHVKRALIGALKSGGYHTEKFAEKLWDDIVREATDDPRNIMSTNVADRVSVILQDDKLNIAHCVASVGNLWGILAELITSGRLVPRQLILLQHSSELTWNLVRTAAETNRDTEILVYVQHHAVAKEKLGDFFYQRCKGRLPELKRTLTEMSRNESTAIVQYQQDASLNAVKIVTSDSEMLVMSWYTYDAIHRDFLKGGGQISPSPEPASAMTDQSGNGVRMLIGGQNPGIVLHGTHPYYRHFEAMFERVRKSMDDSGMRMTVEEMRERIEQEGKGKSQVE